MPQLVLLFSIAAVLMIMSRRRRIAHWLRRTWNSNWTLVQGTIEDHHVHERLDQEHFRHYYDVEVSYSYSVNGEFYSGYHKLDRTKRESEVEKILESFPKGSLLMLRVSQRHPERSCVEKW